jgi:hypothetical protein
MPRPKLFSSHLTRRQRRVYGTVFLFYVFAFFAMVPPIYSSFNRIKPLVLGMPMALFYLAAVIMSSFLVLLTLFLWESRQNSDSPEEDR